MFPFTGECSIPHGVVRFRRPLLVKADHQFPDQGGLMGIGATLGFQSRVGVRVFQQPSNAAPNSLPSNVAAYFFQPQGPTTLVSLLFMPMITHATFPVPSGAQEGEPTPVPPTAVQPDQPEPL